MAKGLIGVGRVQKEQAMGGLLQSARMEAQQDIAEQGLKQQKKLAQAQTAGTLAGVGAAAGYMGKIGGSVAGVPGAVVGAAIGFLASKLFG